MVDLDFMNYYFDMDNQNNNEDFISAIWDAIESNYFSRNDVCGIPVGFRDYDFLLRGLHKSELTVIGSRPSLGKSALAISMFNFILSKQIPALFISYEMNKETLGLRIFSELKEIDLSRILNGYMSQKDLEASALAMNTFSEFSMRGYCNVIPSCFLSIRELIDKIKNFVSIHPDGVVFIDYFQLIPLESLEDRYEQMARNAALLKNTAIELDIPIVLMAQLNKKCEERSYKLPLLFDISECDALAHFADNVLFIHKDIYEVSERIDKNNIFDIIIAKQKNGISSCCFPLIFNDKCCKFIDAPQEDEE